MVYYTNMMYGYGFFGWLPMLVFWAALIWLVVWAIKQFSNSHESSHDILEKRLARGEISKKQYHELKNELRRK